MSAQEKLDEARFFINKILASPNDEKELSYYFSALINAVNSIPDFILDEANEHFELDISEDSRSIRNAFKNEVKNKNNNELTIFYNDWCFVKSEFDENEVLRYRHLNVHRRCPKLINGRYFVVGSPNPENEIIEYYSKLFRYNEGWANGMVINTSEILEIRELNDVYDCDPHFNEITAEIIQSLRERGENPGGLSIVITSNYLEGKLILCDPICIICLKLITISEQFVNFFQRRYSWIAP